VVLPDQTERPVVSLSRRLRGMFNHRPRSDETSDDTIPAELGRRLGARSEHVARQLGRSGLRTRRLSSQQLAELLHRCWSPELARVQRLREEIGAYTTLVVGGRRLALQDQPRERKSAPRAETAADPDDEQHDDEELLALGARTLADLIAPSACEIRRDHVRLDSHYARVLAVTAYPRLVSPGWLGLLVESDLPIELSLHVRPLASADMVRALGVQIARLQSSRLAALRGERVGDPEREIALEDAERLRERLQRGEERLFAVSLYLLLRAKSPRDLDELTGDPEPPAGQSHRRSRSTPVRPRAQALRATAEGQTGRGQ
jgi:hypothetical protein